jgi:hypothetical protein
LSAQPDTAPLTSNLTLPQDAQTQVFESYADYERYLLSQNPWSPDYRPPQANY